MNEQSGTPHVFKNLIHAVGEHGTLGENIKVQLAVNEVKTPFVRRTGSISAMTFDQIGERARRFGVCGAARL